MVVRCRFRLKDFKYGEPVS